MECFYYFGKFFGVFFGYFCGCNVFVRRWLLSSVVFVFSNYVNGIVRAFCIWFILFYIKLRFFCVVVRFFLSLRIVLRYYYILICLFYCRILGFFGRGCCEERCREYFWSCFFVDVVFIFFGLIFESRTVEWGYAFFEVNILGSGFWSCLWFRVLFRFWYGEGF